MKGILFSHGLVIRQDSEVYRILDCKLDDFTVSVTTLHSKQSTKGHTHSQEEFYVILKGKPTLEIGSLSSVMNEYEVAVIPKDIFHKVINESNSDISFLCIFKDANGK